MVDAGWIEDQTEKYSQCPNAERTDDASEIGRRPTTTTKTKTMQRKKEEEENTWFKN